MELYLQIQVLVVSFVYGILFSYVIKVQYKYFFEGKLVYRILLSTVFIFDNMLLYFLILKLINNASFHFYFLILLVLGYILGYKLINYNKK